MLQRLYCLIFILVLFMPTIQHSLNIFPGTTLLGKEEMPPRAHWSVAGWLNGSFQEEYSKRRSARLGLREHFIKTYNQLQYSLFHRVSSSAGTQVVIGKENWLYEKPYIEKYNSRSADDGTLIRKKVQQLRHLQEQLHDAGIAFIFVMAPSKAEIYPEFIPDHLLSGKRTASDATDYQQAKDALEQYGVNYLDGRALFQQEKNGQYQLFGPSGVHWNKYGAYLTWKELAPKVADQLRVSLEIPELAAVQSFPSEPVEADLGGLLNLWDTALTTPVTDYPVFANSSASRPKKQKPSMLIVGDSFIFTLIDIVERAELSTDVDAWYYFKRQYSYPVSNGRIDVSSVVDTAMDAKDIDWNKLFSKDLVLLVETEYWLPELGFGFIEKASAALARASGKGKN